MRHKVLSILALVFQLAVCLSSQPESQHTRSVRDLTSFGGAGGLHSADPGRAGRQVKSSQVTQNEDPITHNLHTGQFCSDISGWTDVFYKNDTEVCCESSFKKNCTEKEKTVMVDVTTMECEVIAWADCSMDWKNTTGFTCDMQPQNYTEKECEIKTRNITHTKMEPHCENVTYDNCVTLWDENANGDKIWTGNEDCKPITWTKCELKPVNKTFQDVYSECKNTTTHPYDSHKNGTKIMTIDIQKCEVKTAVDCKPVTIQKEATAKWQECEDIKMDSCDERPVRRPTQDPIHKKKCLIQAQDQDDDDETTTDGTGEGPDQGESE